MTVILDDKKHREKYAKYYDPGLLVPKHHRKLVENIEKVCGQARIPALYVHTCPLDKYCDEADIGWVKGYHGWADKGVAGMAYTNQVNRVEDRMMAIAGALIRNYIDAKVMTVQEIIQAVKDDDTPMCSTLLVPNFYLPRDSGGKLPEWQVSMLSGAMLSRFSRGVQTVIYVDDMTKLARDYGQMLAEHIKNHYYMVG